jgi:hypothetical protein
MKRSAVTVLGAGIMILAGCTGSTGTGHVVTRSTGHRQAVPGRFVAVGGPAPGAPRPLPGTITARATTGQSFTAAVGHDGRFTLSLPPGRYQVTGHSPLINSGHTPCPATRELRVTRGKPAGPVTVVCSIK